MDVMSFVSLQARYDIPHQRVTRLRWATIVNGIQIEHGFTWSRPDGSVDVKCNTPIVYGDRAYMTLTECPLLHEGRFL